MISAHRVEHDGDRNYDLALHLTRDSAGNITGPGPPAMLD